jgi:hypothetical protein
MSSIDVVTKEQILAIGNISSKLEYFKKIWKLTMNITTDLNWSLNLYNIALLLEYLFSLK